MMPKKTEQEVKEPAPVVDYARAAAYGMLAQYRVAGVRGKMNNGMPLSDAERLRILTWMACNATPGPTSRLPPTGPTSP